LIFFSKQFRNLEY